MSARSLLCFAILVGLGCATPAETVLPVGTVKVTLLDAGSAPFTVLRLQARPGDKCSSEMSFEIETLMSSGRATPSDLTIYAAHVWFDTEVVEVTPGNDIRFEARIRKVSADSEDSPARLKALEGFGWFVVESPRGLTKQYGMIAPEAMTPEQQQALDNINQSRAASPWMLPEEPVGLGARWQVEETVVLFGTNIRQRSTCTLTGIEGNMLSLSVALSQTAPVQDFVLPDRPTEFFRLISLETAGSGSVQLALDRVGFINGSLTITNTTNVEAADKEDKQASSMSVNVSLGLESQ